MRHHAPTVSRRAPDRDLQATLDGIPHLAWVTDPDGRPEYFTARCVEYFSYPPAELLAGAWLEGVHPNDRPRLVAAWEHACRTGEPFAGDYRLCRADGTLRWHTVRALP